MFHIALIVNPFASSVSESVLRAVEEKLVALAPVEIWLTERRGHATEIAAFSAADAIVVFGGDGVANEVLNGVGRDVPIGFLPGGGTNVLARALGAPRDPVRAAERLDLNRTRRITLGRANDRRFAFSCGVGFDAAAVRRVDSLGRASDGRRPGDVAFAWQIARTLAAESFRLEPTLEVVGLGRAAAALIANGDPYTYAGGIALHVAPEAEFELGVDVVAPVELTPRLLPRFARYVLRGDGQQRDRHILYAHDRDRIEVICDRPLPLQADGEDLGDVERLVVEAERDAVTVLA
jgi:diacylglycerol kinase family enzyme